MKRALSAFLCFALLCALLMLNSCGLLARFNQDIFSEEKRGLVKSIVDNTGEFTEEALIYQGKQYFRHSFITADWVDYRDSVDDCENDVAIGWEGSRFGHARVYYSDEIEAPLFIYCDAVYIREDYDAMSDTFTIGGTESQMKVSDFRSNEDTMAIESVAFDDTKYVELRSVTNNRLKFCVRIYEKQGNWYALPNDRCPVEGVFVANGRYDTLLSEHTVNLLRENGVIR